MPNEDGYYFLIVNRFVSTETSRPYVTHTAIRSNTGEIFVDVCDYGTWRGWKRQTYNLPDFYKNYNDLAALSQGLANGYVQVPMDSFASLQGKNYPSFRWLNDGTSTPFPSNQYSTLMGRCVTSLNDSSYTMIDIWHVASPHIIYHGMMQNNVVGTWYKMDMTVV